jgi:hypothetical protein
MTFKSSTSPFTLSSAQLELVHQQRAITAAINKSFIQVAAIYLASNAKSPTEEGWQKKTYLSTDLQEWIDDEDKRFFNVGFNLQLGWLDIDIDAADGADRTFNQRMVDGLRACGIDTRFAFGRQSVGAPTHILVQLAEADHENFDKLKAFSPKEFRLNGNRYENQLRAYPPSLKDKALADGAKQTVMPGSVYTHKKLAATADPSVWWTADGKVASSVKDIAATTARRASFRDIVRGIAFGVVLYLLEPHWIEGQRQNVASKFTGWLARVVGDSAALNTHDRLNNEVFCCVDSDEHARALIEFVCSMLGDDEASMRYRAYYDARRKLERNPEAKIPGWNALGDILTTPGMNALRAVFMPGSDVSPLAKFAEQYIYDRESGQYIDVSAFKSRRKYMFEAEKLMRRHMGEVIRVADKSVDAFVIYERSKMRKSVNAVDMYPDLDPGRIYVRDSLGDILNEDEEMPPEAYTFFNQWEGWQISPVEEVNLELMKECNAKLDRLLGYLTCDNKEQIEWIKDWFAWTLQHPATKQQIAWVVVGGMGVGKSFIGNTFAKAVFGHLWGSASPQIIDQKFNVSSFLGKMMVFIDEARFNGEAAGDEVKKLIRNVSFHGMEKGVDAKDYNIYARIMFAANKFNLNLGNGDTHDRALFYTKAYTREYLGMSDRAFKEWAEGLKPFFAEYAAFLERRDVKRHYMRMLMDRPVVLTTVESTQHSASNDVDLVVHNMTYARQIARSIVQSGWIIEHTDISTPFTNVDLNNRITAVNKELGLSNVPVSRVLAEFTAADMLEDVIAGGSIGRRFKWKIGALHEKFGDATGAPIASQYVFNESDYERNEATTVVQPRPKLGRTSSFSVVEGGRGKV